MRKALIALALVGMTTCAFPAWGQSWARSWYVGAGLGHARAVDAGTSLASGGQDVCNLALLTGSSSCNFSARGDDTDTAYSVFVGGQFTPYVAGELGYVDFGSYGASGTLSATGGSLGGVHQFTERDRPSATYLAAVLSYPVLRRWLSVFGKLGIGYMHNEEDCTVSGTGCASHSDNSWEPVFGVGVSTTVTSLFELRLAYSQFNSVGDRSWEYTAGDFRYAQLSGLVRF